MLDERGHNISSGATYIFQIGREISLHISDLEG